MRTGITRKVDDLGRVVIPAGIRRSLDMREGETVEVAVEGDQVILFKPVDECVFCGEEAGLRAFRGKSVCRSCIAAVGVLDDSLRERPPEEPVEGKRDLPPWPVEGKGDTGRAPARRAGRTEGSDRAAGSTAPAPTERRAQDGPDAENTRPARAGQDDQEPPASTTAW